MVALLFALLASVTPHTASEANRLAHARRWDDLYLAFAAAKPDAFPGRERLPISVALSQGCEALEASDAVMAYSLADRAAAFAPTAEGLLCLTRAARRCDQRGAAEKALRDGLTRFPADGRFGLELGRQLLEDRDPVGALAALERVPRGSPQASEAERLIRAARSGEAADAAARRNAETVERAIARGQPVRNAPPAPAGAVDTISYQSGVTADGRRTRANRRFVLEYFNGQRDFGQRAEYEGQLVEAMEDAHRFARSVLGLARNKPCRVVLYTREKFLSHFGPAAAQAIAGLYWEDAIRVNDAAELTPETRSTLVHEYVHAVVDEVAHFHSRRIPVWMNEGLAEYVEWRYQGRDAPAVPYAVALRSQALAHQTPRLSALARGPLIAGAAPPLLYAESAVAVRILLESGGTDRLLGLFSALGEGEPFEDAFRRSYGRPLSSLQEDLEAELARN